MKRYIRSSQLQSPTKRQIKASTQYDDYFVYTRNRQDFGVHTKYEDEPEDFQCQISEIHPYDLAEYAWVKKDSPASATFFKSGKKIGVISVPEWDEDDYEDANEYINEIIDRLCVELRHVNSRIQPRIDRT